MTTKRERIAAAQVIAEQSGKPIAEVIGILAPSWGMGGAEAGALAHEARQLAPPPTSVQRGAAHTARTEATQLQTSGTASADARAVTTFRRYREVKASNPHAASLFLNRHADEISRGRAIEETPTPDPGPEAA